MLFRVVFSSRARVPCLRDIDQVEDLKDTIAEQMDMSEEINEAISGPLGTDFDDDELMDELNDLTTEAAEDEFAAVDTQMAGVPALPDAAMTMPTVPSSKPVVKVAKKTQEEAELAELE